MRQLLLLFIRTLAIAVLVLAFARPAFQTGSGAGSAASVEYVIVVDDGLNSAAESRDGQLLQLAARRIDGILDLVSPGDQVTLIPLSKPSRKIEAGLGQVDLLRDYLYNIEPSFRRPKLPETAVVIDSILSASSRFNREVFFVGGFFSSGWDSLRLSDATETEKRFLLPVELSDNRNLSVDGIEMKSSILQVGRPVEISAMFHNHGSKKASDVLVSVYLEGTRVFQSSIELESKSSAVKSFTIIPEKPGYLAGSVKIEDVDPLTVDNRSWFILNIPDSLRVLAVFSKPATRKIIEAVFSAEEAKFVSITGIDSRSWETKSLSGFDVLLMTGISSVSSGAADRVVEFVQRGGGVVIFQDPNSDLSDLSRGFWHKLGFAGAKGIISDNTIGWGKTDLDHPLFSGMFDRDGSPRSPRIEFLVDLAIEKYDQVIIPLSNGRPFLIERRVGNGRALMFAIPLGPEAGDFIYTGIAAPLLLRSSGYAATGRDITAWEWTTGSAFSVVLPVSRSGSMQLIQPDGNQVELLPNPVIGGVEFNVSQVEMPGVFELKSEGKTVAKYAANIPTDQSDLQMKTDDFIKNNSPALLSKDEGVELAEYIKRLRFGRELWFPVAVAFVLLLLSESIIGRSGGRE